MTADLRSSEALLQRMKAVAKLKATPEDLHRQRISFILGQMNETSDITREKVEKVLKQQEGNC